MEDPTSTSSGLCFGREADYVRYTEIKMRDSNGQYHKDAYVPC